MAKSTSIWTLVGCVAAAFTAFVSPVADAEISVVTPSQYADSEGPNHSGIFPDAMRVQSIADRAEFDALPDGGAWLTEIRWRPDGDVAVGAVASFGRIQISLSVTQVDPLDISYTFANNITGTPIEVRNAAWSSTAINANPPGPETRPFDWHIPLETAYFYNPAEGNLLFDWILESPGAGTNNGASWDTDFVNLLSETRAIETGSLGADSPVSLPRTFSVIRELIFIPEPSTFALAALAFLAVVCRVRRTRASLHSG